MNRCYLQVFSSTWTQRDSSWVIIFFSAPSLSSTHTGTGYRQPKASLPLRNCVRPWEWTEFTNSARQVSHNVHWLGGGSLLPVQEFPQPCIGLTISTPSISYGSEGGALHKKKITQLQSLCVQFLVKTCCLHLFRPLGLRSGSILLSFLGSCMRVNMHTSCCTD